MKKTIDIERLLCPQKNKLKMRKGIVTTKIVDAELDIVNCEFGGDGTVTLDTKNLTYIILDHQNLIDLLDLLDQADEMCEDYCE